MSFSSSDLQLGNHGPAIDYRQLVGEPDRRAVLPRVTDAERQTILSGGTSNETLADSENSPGCQFLVSQSVVLIETTLPVESSRAHSTDQG